MVPKQNVVILHAGNFPTISGFEKNLGKVLTAQLCNINSKAPEVFWYLQSYFGGQAEHKR